MKNIITTALLPLLAGLAFSCTSSTALQSSENDDLYYASTDRTVRPEANYVTASENGSGSEEVTNPEYSTAESGQASITNNYNYYDNNRYSSRNYAGSRFRNYNYYSADPFYDPFYSPFGYSAAYCYNLYDPFWYPYCYPSRGLTISIGYGFGYPGYGYYGYRPYGYGYGPYDYYGYGYGGGYGNYYHGFYDGYYAGSGYGYGYNRQRVNYAPRTNRSNVPGNAPVNNVTGRPSVPGGRVAQPNPNTGTVIPGSRPNRIAQPGTSPGKAVQPVNSNSPQNGREQQVPSGRPAQNSRPGREVQNIQPENYQFQNNAQPTPEYSRPARDNATVPTQSRPGRAPLQDVSPARPQEAPVQAPVQIEQPSRREQRRMQSQPNYQPSPQRSAPVYENSRPSRNDNSGGSYSSPGRGSSGSSMPSGGGGRPRR
ncbi:hypothetical protein [Adhaeribacter terreus]|uniref:Prolyl-tRNA synthetase n=1 Tax=Adhaeribacter terreus TaxID=529703 RepID=A0ABW0ECV8_9BACT